MTLQELLGSLFGLYQPKGSLPEGSPGGCPGSSQAVEASFPSALRASDLLGSLTPLAIKQLELVPAHN